MINKATEVIIGVNYDKTIGNDVMIFGTGGIYTEVMKDTSLRILPTKDFSEMIKETKVGKILNGVRGEAPKAVGPLADTMEKIQRIIFAIFSEYFLKSEIYIVKFDYKQVNHKTDFYGRLQN